MLEQQRLLPKGGADTVRLAREERGPRGIVRDELDGTIQSPRFPADRGGPELLLGHRDALDRRAVRR